MRALVNIGLCLTFLVASCTSEPVDILSGRFCDEQGREYVLSDNQTGRRAVIFLDTACELCLLQFRELLDHAKMFSHAQVLLVRQVSEGPSCRWPETFRNGNNPEQLLFLSVSGDWLENRVNTFPLVLIVNERGEVIKRYEGLVGAASLVRALNAGNK